LVYAECQRLHLLLPVAACRGSIAEVATKNQSGKSYSISGTIAPVCARCAALLVMYV
jgi:hypothetical protein